MVAHVPVEEAQLSGLDLPLWEQTSDILKGEVRSYLFKAADNKADTGLMDEIARVIEEITDEDY